MLHQIGKTLVLGQRLRLHALHRKQAVLPLALKKKPLLRAVAQVAFVILPAASDPLAQTEFLQKVLHLGCIVARQRQVVGTQRTGHTAEHAAAAVASCAVLHFQQGKVVQALQPQGTRGRQSGHPAAGNQNLGLEGALRRRPVRATL